MKTAIFTIKIWDNEFIFDSEQDDLETIKDIYEKRIKPKYPNFDFDNRWKNKIKTNNKTERPRKPGLFLLEEDFISFELKQ